MSSVGTSDFSYIQRSLDESRRAVNDAEDHREVESRRLRKARDEDVAKVERDYQVILKDQKEETSESLRVAKDSLKKDLESEREISKGQYADVKRQVYDRYGKMVEGDLSEGRSQLDRAQKSLEDAIQGQRKSNASVDEAYQAKLRDIAEESRQRGEQSAERARESAMEAYRNTYEGDKAEYVSQKKELQEAYAKLTQEVLDRLRSEKQQLEHAQKQTELDFRHREDSLRKVSNGKIDALGEHFDRKTTTAVLNQKRSYEDSSSQLRAQISDLLELQREYTKGKAEGRAESIQEFEDDVRTRERMLLEKHDTELDNYKESSKEQFIRSSEHHAQQLAEREKRFARLMREVNQENRGRQVDIVKQFTQSNDQLRDQMKRDRELSNQNMERMADSSAEQNRRAMESQATSYQQTIADQRADLGSQLTQLEKQLRDAKSSTDPTNITPAAEAAVRQSIQSEYQKLKDAETDSSKRQVEGIRFEYNQALEESRDNARIREQELVHDRVLAEDKGRAAFFNYTSDMESTKQHAIRSMESDHEREMQQLAKSFAQAIMKQERATQESVKALMNSYENKLMAVRDEARFKEGMGHRKFNIEQAQLAKAYDRKMDDTVQDYEVKLEELRREVAQAKTDVERRSRQLLEEQERAYTHQIEQMKQTQVEREKTIAMNYEDQMEVMRRSNARISQKKG